MFSVIFIAIQILLGLQWGYILIIPSRVENIVIEMRLTHLTHQTLQLSLTYLKHSWNSYISLQLGKNPLTQKPIL